MIFATFRKEISRWYESIICKNIFKGYFIRKIFDFLLFSELKLHFQQVIFGKI